MFNFFSKVNKTNLTRENIPLQTSDNGKKTVSVLAHYFLLPKRAKSVYGRSRHDGYFNKKLGILPNSISTM